MAPRALVFAYHDVGVRCLSVLLAHGVEVALVVTHRDDPRETLWFASVERLAREHGLETIAPEASELAALAPRLAALAPDFLFSFYYRHMLPPAILGCARRGAYNVHGSLLPKYRGRVPVNWAILKGERETGATLHEMVDKPDAGRIVDRMAVPILPDDVALDVFRKVTVAAEIVLDRALPSLLDGRARPVAQDLSKGSYFGGRRPEDGRIDWSKGAREIHDLVRAVAPPYPGAFTAVEGTRMRVLRSLVLREAGPATAAASLEVDGDGRLVARCRDGGILRILEWAEDGEPLDAAAFVRRFGRGPLCPEALP
ncbi:MAG TPA: formyltransferase [Usitatibacter sp.]|nr:formyltransferase [Usitatibacter sp.]